MKSPVVISGWDLWMLVQAAGEFALLNPTNPNRPEIVKSIKVACDLLYEPENTNQSPLLHTP